MNQLTGCERLIQIRAPEFLRKAPDQAADRRLSRSDYVRLALLGRLRADGVDPSAVLVQEAAAPAGADKG
jgi:hypothetical protein